MLVPLGLLGLLGIPVLILIYIIKPKYHERTISSTYIWKLSRKYRKRRIPFEKITQSLLLILQILIIAVMAVLLTKPYFETTNYQKKMAEQILIIDSSASMMAKDSSGTTRFDNAIKQASEIASNASTDAPVTIIVANQKPECIVPRSSDPILIKHALASLTCSYATADYAGAIDLAADILDENGIEAKVSLYTDRNFKQEGYVDVINLASNEWNCVVTGLTSRFSDGYFSFAANVDSFNQDADVILRLELEGARGTHEAGINGMNQWSTEKRVKITSDGDDVGIQVPFDNTQIYSFESARVVILNSDGTPVSDSFDLDNEYYTFGGDDTRFKVQLVSTTKTFVEAAIRSLGNCDITVVDPTETNGVWANTGFDLYIVDQATPFLSVDNLPQDGTLWLFNPSSNSNFNELGFTTNSEITKLNDPSIAAEDKYYYSATTLPTDDQESIMYSINANDIFVTKYTSVNFAEGTNYQSYLSTTNDGSPLIFGGRVGLVDVMVMLFDHHYSNMTMTANWPIFISNAVKQSVHHTVDKYLYKIGDQIEIHTNANVESLDIIRNNDMNTAAHYVGISETIVMNAAQSGVYRVIEKDKGADKTIETKFFVRIEEEESNFVKMGDVLAGNEHQKPNEEEAETTEKILNDISKYFAIALLVLLLIEWGVQYREQY